MKKTFVCDDSMIITIPIGTLRGGNEMPEKFHCVYKDCYKVFALKGKPKPLGAAQIIAGVFIVSLSLISGSTKLCHFISPLSCVFFISGMLSYLAGRSPNIHVTKLSFSLNIISLFSSIAAVILCVVIKEDIMVDSTMVNSSSPKPFKEVSSLVMSLLVVEKLIALFLIYWLSKAVCREHFNTLPIILLKQGD